MITTPVGTLIPTGIPSITTTGLPPTTTTMNYCIEEKGMNQPLTIESNNVKLNPSPEQTTPPVDINPTSDKRNPGLDFPSTNPQINITFDQPATLTLIYVPVDRPNQPSNVNQFVVTFIYPDGTPPQSFTSNISLINETTTTTTTTTTTPPLSSIPSETTPSPIYRVPPSNISPQVDLPANFRVPKGTIVVININSTKDGLNPNGVCILFLLLKLLF